MGWRGRSLEALRPGYLTSQCLTAESKVFRLVAYYVLTKLYQWCIESEHWLETGSCLTRGLSSSL